LARNFVGVGGLFCGEEGGGDASAFTASSSLYSCLIRLTRLDAGVAGDDASLCSLRLLRDLEVLVNGDEVDAEGNGLSSSTSAAFASVTNVTLESR